MTGKMALSSFEHPIMSKVTPTSKRKSDHIRINLEQDVRSGRTTGLEQFRFEHNAVPELNLSDIDLRTEFLGKILEAPLLISSMTGGTEKARSINIALAIAAQEKGIALGLGSQRAALENPEVEKTFNIRSEAPDIPIYANLGAVQLNYGYGIDECRRAVDMVSADALIFHFNSLQEAIQPEGDANFEGLLFKLEKICSELSVPVIAKEVGWGISADAARRLVNSGVSAIDVAGAGGTSWSEVEMHRAQDPDSSELASSFLDWGIPTAAAVLNARGELPSTPIIASGGLRSGIDIAKCIALGANLGGMAGPFLKSAVESAEAVCKSIDLITSQIRVCMFAAGCSDMINLSNAALHPTS
jgi:isopentenyl-diphosphate delta-isomerase